MPEINWDDVPSGTGREFFKPSKLQDGETVRIAMLADRPVVEYVHFVPNANLPSFVCVGEKDFDSKGAYRLITPGVCCEMIGQESNALYCMPIIHYNADFKGKVAGAPKNVEYTLKLWTFSGGTAARLIPLIEEYGATGHDWRITWSTTGRTPVISAVLKAKQHLRVKPGLKKRIDEELKTWWGKDHEAAMAVKWDEDEVIERLEEALRGTKADKKKAKTGARGGRASSLKR